MEGFQDGGGAASAGNFFGDYYPRRTDVIPGQTVEDGGWVRDLRYKEEYVDVQRVGFKNDLCRVVMRRGDPGSMIMACALAGGDGTPARGYKTRSKAEGFKFGRDDYFREVNGDLRDDYCRIVKTSMAPDDAWQSLCAPAELAGFGSKEINDSEPPPEIIDMLWFYEGLMAWYRFKDDMLDYADNTFLSLAGGLKIDEDPTRTKTDGLRINEVPASLMDSPGPAEQFIRLAENKELELDRKFELRQMRAFSVWVNFDIFTNNARIFDFGNGAGHDNVFVGIEGRGNDVGPSKKKATLTAQPLDEDAVCNRKAAREVAPSLFMKETAANVELYECPGPEPIDPAVIKKEEEEVEVTVKRANLLFEIWDKEQRKMRIKVVDAIQERKWHHIVFTTVDTAFRPTWEVYIDGLKVFTKEEGHLPQTGLVAKNYIGRSNWEGAAGQGEYKDERFRGSMFDLRFYRTPMSEAKIMKTLEWGENLIENLGRESRAAAIRNAARQQSADASSKARTAEARVIEQRKAAEKASKKATEATAKTKDLQQKLIETESKLKKEQAKLKQQQEEAAAAAKKAAQLAKRCDEIKKKAEAREKKRSGSVSSRGSKGSAPGGKGPAPGGKGPAPGGKGPAGKGPAGGRSTTPKRK